MGITGFVGLATEIGKLRALAELDVTGNNISSLPTEIGDLGELQTM